MINLQFPIVLASASPRRLALLTAAGFSCEAAPVDVDERLRDAETPGAYVERLARLKAEAGAARHPSRVVLAADTTVVVDGDVLGKPVDEADAARMLRRLSGRSHVVMTAVAVAWDGRIKSAVEEVEVTFHALSDAEVAAYISTREPMDTAGAYGIQGFGATIVARVDGDYFAVMGLALQLLVRLFRKLGLRYRFGAVELA